MSSRDKRDVYYRLAKEHNLRARSAFKLLQIDKHFNIFEDVHCVIDLCAAPGGWSILASDIMQHRAKITGYEGENKVIAVDVVPIHDIPNVESFVGDITQSETAYKIISKMGTTSDLVIMDGAPEVTGFVDHDEWQQHILVRAGAVMCLRVLKEGGSYVAKVFRGRRMGVLRDSLLRLFTKVTVVKPQASRNSSLEVFILCEGLRDVSKFDAFSLQDMFSLGIDDAADAVGVGVGVGVGVDDGVGVGVGVGINSNDDDIPFYLCNDIYDSDSSYPLTQHLPYDVYGYLDRSLGSSQKRPHSQISQSSQSIPQ